MKSTDPFEERLQAAQFRSPPAQWRARILCDAAPAVERRRRRRPALGFLALLRSVGGAPAPRLSAGLAAAWVVILALRLASPGGAAAPAPRGVVDLRPALEERREILSALNDDPVERESPVRGDGGPRSDGGRPDWGWWRTVRCDGSSACLTPSNSLS